MTEFIQYWKIVAGRAAGMWWEFVWSNFLLAAILSAAVFVLGAVAKSDSETLRESFRQWREAPMNNIYEWIWGGVGVLALVGVSFLVFLFVVSPQQIYSEQSGKLEAAATEANTGRPNLTGEIEGYCCGMLSNKHIALTAPYVAFRVMVRNTGAPSIVDDWRLVFEKPNGERIKGLPVFFRGDGPIMTDDDEKPAVKAGMAQVTEATTVFDKNTTPVPSGGVLRGWAPFVFPNHTAEESAIYEIKNGGVVIVLEFSDINRKRIRCVFNSNMEPMDDLPEGFVPAPY